MRIDKYDVPFMNLCIPCTKCIQVNKRTVVTYSIVRSQYSYRNTMRFMFKMQSACAKHVTKSKESHLEDIS